MPVHVPTQIAGRSLMHRRRSGREIGGYVVLEAALTDKMQQPLQVRDFHYPPRRAYSHKEAVAGFGPAFSVLTHVAPHQNAGSRIFQPLIKSQSMKNNSPRNVTKRNPRWAFGNRYGLELSIIQPNPSITNKIPNILGM